MKISQTAASAALLLWFAAPAAFAGTVERACMKSDSQKASRVLCGCIQQAADMTLSGSDQRKAASFFKDPDRAQKVKMSTTDRDDAFWDRYKAFGELAESFCAG